jgi:hypothetical protein
MKPPMRVFLCVLILFGLQFALIAPVSACQWGSNATLEESLADADVIALGVVTGQEDVFSNIYLIQVDAYLKGEGVNTIVVDNFGFGGGDCKNKIAIGERWIFFIDGDAATDAVLHASYASPYQAIIEPTDETMARITAITGNTSVPQPIPFAKSLQYIPYSRVFHLMKWIGLPLLVVVGLIVFAARVRRRGSHKAKISEK